VKKQRQKHYHSPRKKAKTIKKTQNKKQKEYTGD